jgi:hypothetical protein
MNKVEESIEQNRKSNDIVGDDVQKDDTNTIEINNKTNETDQDKSQNSGNTSNKSSPSSTDKTISTKNSENKPKNDGGQSSPSKLTEIKKENKPRRSVSAKAEKSNENDPFLLEFKKEILESYYLDDNNKLNLNLFSKELDVQKSKLPLNLNDENIASTSVEYADLKAHIEKFTITHLLEEYLNKIKLLDQYNYESANTRMPIFSSEFGENYLNDIDHNILKESLNNDYIKDVREIENNNKKDDKIYEESPFIIEYKKYLSSLDQILYNDVDNIQVLQVVLPPKKKGRRPKAPKSDSSLEGIKKTGGWPKGKKRKSIEPVFVDPNLPKKKRGRKPGSTLEALAASKAIEILPDPIIKQKKARIVGKKWIIHNDDNKLFRTNVQPSEALRCLYIEFEKQGFNICNKSSEIVLSKIYDSSDNLIIDNSKSLIDMVVEKKEEEIKKEKEIKIVDEIKKEGEFNKLEEIKKEEGEVVEGEEVENKSIVKEKDIMIVEVEPSPSKQIKSPSSKPISDINKTSIIYMPSPLYKSIPLIIQDDLDYNFNVKMPRGATTVAADCVKKIHDNSEWFDLNINEARKDSLAKLQNRWENGTLLKVGILDSNKISLSSVPLFADRIANPFNCNKNNKWDWLTTEENNPSDVNKSSIYYDKLNVNGVDKENLNESINMIEDDKVVNRVVDNNAYEYLPFCSKYTIDKVSALLSMGLSGVLIDESKNLATQYEKTLHRSKLVSNILNETFFSDIYASGRDQKLYKTLLGNSGQCGPCLVLCKVSDMVAWETSLMEICGKSLQVLSYYGSSSDIESIRSYLSSDELYSVRSNCHILLVNYETFLLDFMFFKSISWHAAVLDESLGLISNINYDQVKLEFSSLKIKHRILSLSSLITSVNDNKTDNIGFSNDLNNSVFVLPDVIEVIEMLCPNVLSMLHHDEVLGKNKNISLDELSLRYILRLLASLTTVCNDEILSDYSDKVYNNGLELVQSLPLMYWFGCTLRKNDNKFKFEFHNLGFSINYTDRDIDLELMNIDLYQISTNKIVPVKVLSTVRVVKAMGSGKGRGRGRGGGSRGRIAGGRGGVDGVSTGRGRGRGRGGGGPGSRGGRGHLTVSANRGVGRGRGRGRSRIADRSLVYTPILITNEDEASKDTTIVNDDKVTDDTIAENTEGPIKRSHNDDTVESSGGLKKKTKGSSSPTKTDINCVEDGEMNEDNNQDGNFDENQEEDIEEGEEDYNHDVDNLDENAEDEGYNQDEDEEGENLEEGDEDNQEDVDNNVDGMNVDQDNENNEDAVTEDEEEGDEGSGGNDDDDDDGDNENDKALDASIITDASMNINNDDGSNDDESDNGSNDDESEDGSDSEDATKENGMDLSKDDNTSTPSTTQNDNSNPIDTQTKSEDKDSLVMVVKDDNENNEKKETGNVNDKDEKKKNKKNKEPKEKSSPSSKVLPLEVEITKCVVKKGNIWHTFISYPNRLRHLGYYLTEAEGNASFTKAYNERTNYFIREKISPPKIPYPKKGRIKAFKGDLGDNYDYIEYGIQNMKADRLVDDLQMMIHNNYEIKNVNYNGQEIFSKTNLDSITKVANISAFAMLIGLNGQCFYLSTLRSRIGRISKFSNHLLNKWKSDSAVIDKINYNKKISLSNEDDISNCYDIITISSDYSVAKQHVEINWDMEKGSFYITCLSEAGIYINGNYTRPIDGNVTLLAKTIIQIGCCMFYFLLPTVGTLKMNNDNIKHVCTYFFLFIKLLICFIFSNFFFLFNFIVAFKTTSQS